MTILLALLAGSGLGYILERGDFCFHSTLRGLFRTPQRLDLFRAYLLVLLIATPLVGLMRWQGWIDPWIPPFAWQANLVGGLIFGVGMVVAATCVTGMFYKLGHGMLGVLVAMAAWAAGDILTYVGPLSPLREALNRSVITADGAPATLLNIGGATTGVILLAALAAAMFFYLWRAPRKPRSPLWGWLLLGVAAGLFTSLAWLVAKAGGSNYTYGTSYVPTTIFLWARNGAGFDLWIPLALFAIIPGALAAAKFSGTLWVRGESGRRYAELGAGGLLMGTGAAISGGCNLGHSLVGVPLLSLGSITATLAMALGVFVAHNVAKRIGRVQNESAFRD